MRILYAHPPTQTHTHPNEHEHCVCMVYTWYLCEAVPEELLFPVAPAKPGAPETALQLQPLSLTVNNRSGVNLLLLLALFQ